MREIWVTLDIEMSGTWKLTLGVSFRNSWPNIRYISLGQCLLKLVSSFYEGLNKI